MTLDEAIDNFERETGEFEGLKKIRAVTDEDYVKIERTRQFAEWLKELKQLREKENNNELKDLSKRVENIENQMKKDKEEQNEIHS